MRLYLQEKLPNWFMLIILAIGLLQLGRCNNSSVVPQGLEGINSFPIEDKMIDEAEKEGLNLLAKTLQDIKHYQEEGKDIQEAILKLDERDEKKHNETSLHQAVYLGNPELFSSLLKKGYDVNAKAANDATPLHVAVHKGDVKIVKLLLENGAEIEATTKNLKRRPIHLAAEQNNIELLNLLIEKGAKLDAPAHRGATALHLAANRGHVKAMELLISQGANINSQDLDGITPLHLAAHKGNLDAIDFLVGKGINLRTADAKLFTSLHLAVEAGHKDAVEKLLQADMRVRGNVPAGNLVQPFIELGGNQGAKPLHVAAYKGKEEMVKFLLEQGASIDSIDYHGFTALHWAALKGHPKVVEVLLQKGANKKIKDSRNNTPKQVAKSAPQVLRVPKAEKGNYKEVVKLLSKSK